MGRLYRRKDDAILPLPRTGSVSSVMATFFDFYPNLELSRDLVVAEHTGLIETAVPSCGSPYQFIKINVRFIMFDLSGGALGDNKDFIPMW